MGDSWEMVTVSNSGNTDNSGKKIRVVLVGGSG